MHNSRMKLNVKNYRLEDLPETPFAIYKLDAEGQVYPKRVFTVTKKFIDEATLNIKFRTLEDGECIEYSPESIMLVSMRLPN